MKSPFMSIGRNLRRAFRTERRLPHRHRPRLACELLEDRRVPAGFGDSLVPGISNIYQDVSREHLYYHSGAAGIQVGDIVLGFIEIEAISTPGAPAITQHAIYAVFAIQVAGFEASNGSGGPSFGPVTSDNTKDQIVFKPVPAADPSGLSLQEILGNVTTTSGSQALPDGTMAVVFDKQGGAAFANLINNLPPDGSTTSNAQIQNWFTYLKSTGTFEVGLGFTGTFNTSTGKTSNNDFFNTVLNGFGGVTSAAAAKSSLLNSLGTGPDFASNFGGLSVTLNNTNFAFATATLGQDAQNHQVTVSSAAEIGAGGSQPLANFNNWGLVENTGTTPGDAPGNNPGPNPSTSLNDAGTSDNATFTFAPQARPQISTTAQPKFAAVGSSIADKATVTGLVNPSGTDTITFNLYSSATKQDSTTLLFTDTETVSLNGSTATATSKGSPAITAAGTDYWVDTFNGDSTNAKVTSGATAEPVAIEDAYVTIGPSATNPVGAPHTFTAQFFENTGTGYVTVPDGTAVTVTLTAAGGASITPISTVPSSNLPGPGNPSDTFNLITTTIGGNGGEVQVTFTSPTAGTVTGHANFTITLNGVMISRATGDGKSQDSSDAVKTFTQLTTQGLTIGFWKNNWDKHNGSAWQYTYNPLTGQAFQGTDTLASAGFNLTGPYASLANVTLEDALSLPGGSTLLADAQLLLKQAVGALLNATYGTNPFNSSQTTTMNYALTRAQVLSQVNSALATQDAATILVLQGQLDADNSAEGFNLSQKTGLLGS
jgi:hypothetical protein